MMGGGAFVLLKGGRAGPESSNQVEICLASLLKILCIGRSARPNLLSRQGGPRTEMMLVGLNFSAIPRDMANLPESLVL
jgi:hypothetical protein